MKKIPSFNSFIEKSIIDNWDLDALTDYQGVTLQYKDVARKIEKLHIMFENSGVVKGDKIAICGRNRGFYAAASPRQNSGCHSSRMPMSAQTIFPHSGAEASAICKGL